MKLLDGKIIAHDLYTKLQRDVVKIQSQGIQPQLVIVLVGDDPASESYIRAKKKTSEKIGMTTSIMRLEPEGLTTEKLVEIMHELNADANVHGILVQLPLPPQIEVPLVLRAIAPEKDVDGFTAYNLGKMLISKDFEDLVPCTPLGIIRMLESENIDVEGKEVVVVGRSNLVGKPIAIMLMNRGATVTVCHSKTRDLASHTRRAEILIVAVGRAGLITGDMVQEGVIVIDVGVNRTDKGKLVGDCDFESVSAKASFMTPVPGGCGPMTVACLSHNILRAIAKQHPSLS